MKLTVGRTVHYTGPDGKCRSATVTGFTDDGKPNLTVLKDGPADLQLSRSGQAGRDTVWVPGVMESDPGQRHTWHWPERAEE